MDYCRIQQSILHLKGITSSSQFTISNTHPQFALTYSILPPCTVAKIQIFPQSGTILPEGKQIVRIKCLEWVKYSSYRTSSPHKSTWPWSCGWQMSTIDFFQKRKNHQVWNKIINSPILRMSVIVKCNSEKNLIQNQIKQSILLAKTFGDSAAEISSIDQKQHEQIFSQDEPIFSELKIESNLKKSQQRAHKVETQYQKPVLLEQSQFFNKSIESAKNPFQRMNLAVPTPSRVFSSPKIFNRNDIFQTERNLSQKQFQQRQMRQIYEVILLTILAALFVVLGNKIKHIFP